MFHFKNKLKRENNHTITIYFENDLEFENIEKE